MDSPEYTNFGGLAERPDDAVHHPYVGVGGPAAPFRSPRPGASFQRELAGQSQIPDPSTQKDWPEEVWPKAAAFTASEPGSAQGHAGQDHMVLLDNWIVWFETAIERQKRVVSNDASLKAGAAAAFPLGVLSISVPMWVSEQLASINESVGSAMAGIAALMAGIYIVIWSAHELPPRWHHMTLWSSWKQNNELLRKMESQLLSYRMQRNKLSALKLPPSE